MTTLLSAPLFFIKTLFTHLWLSISSVKFYEQVFNSYKGYGIKYILILSLISSFFCTILFLNHMDKVREYLSNGTISANVENIDHIIQQLPELDYDGLKISTQEETPVFLYNLKNQKILALDPNNKLMPADRTKLPIILNAQKIIINLTDSDGITRNTFPINYTQIFGDTPQILSQTIIKSSLADIFDRAPSIFIYLIFPATSLLVFINALLEKSFIILMIYLITRFITINTSVKTCIRLVLFASGIFVLLQFIIILTIPALSTVLWGIQTWANILMILGILKASGRPNIFSR
ncbi:MAG: DUF1189 domain-containing protein [Rickettsiaceae bacterium]|nr:DUF1189 domain-containing protein [Rickettsiaceae bacterium]